MRKSIYNTFAWSLLLALCSLLYTACTPSAIEESKLYLNEQEANTILDQGIYLSLQQFKDSFMTEKGNYLSDTTQYRTRTYCVQGRDTSYLFSIDTIPASSTPIYIRGRVTTDDQGGNFYKTLCIQQVFIDGNDTTQEALRISVDAGSINGLYPMGQEIMIRVDGLAIGRYANQPQLCLPSYNNNIYANNAEQKIGWAAGRIPMAIFKARTQCIGLPDQSKLYYEEMLIQDFTKRLNQYSKVKEQLQEARRWDAKLIKVKNVHYTGEYFESNGSISTCTFGNPEDDTKANVFAPTTTNIGYPQGRIISDSTGTNKTAVSTSEYAKFAYFYLPGAEKNSIANCKNYVGEVVGILGYYNDNGNYKPASDDWAISIRSLDDLRLYDKDNNLWPRIEYTK